MDLVLHGATVVDGWSNQARPNTSLLLRNGYIAAMGSAEAIGTPDGAEVLDMAGRWIIPGLIDMHCHIKDHYAAHFVAAGVTTVRNTAGNPRELHELRTAPVDAPAPRVITAGRIIDGSPGTWPGGSSPWQALVDDPEGARAEVRAQAAEGVELIKVYGGVSREVLQAAVEEASAHGLPVSVDLMYSALTVRDAARMGVRWTEHATGFVQALYPGFQARDSATYDLVPWEEPESPELDALCAEVADLGLHVCPTLTLVDQARLGAHPWRPDFPTMAGMEPKFSYWSQMAGSPGLARYGRTAGFVKAIARAFRRAGGVVVPGTDVPAGVWVWPGVALHRELELFVQNGWSPMEALQAATSVAARVLGRSDIGAIRPGARAELVVLSADPLSDIRNTLAIERVIKGGRSFTPEELPGLGAPLEQTMAKFERIQAEFAQLGR